MKKYAINDKNQAMPARILPVNEEAFAPQVLYYVLKKDIGNKLLSVFGCGAVALATFDSYIKSKPLTKDELI